jgi:signal peptidase II
MQKEADKRIMARLNAIIISLCGLIIILLDRGAKHFFYNNQERVIKALEDVEFTHYANEGIAFSIGMPRFLIFAATGAIVIFLIAWLFKRLGEKKYFESAAIGIIILGALGNLADRLVYGHVVDYISIYYYPVFNLSDVLVVAGAAWWFALMIMDSKKIQDK